MEEMMMKGALEGERDLVLQERVEAGVIAEIQGVDQEVKVILDRVQEVEVVVEIRGVDQDQEVTLGRFPEVGVIAKVLGLGLGQEVLVGALVGRFQDDDLKFNLRIVYSAFKSILFPFFVFVHLTYTYQSFLRSLFLEKTIQEGSLV